MSSEKSASESIEASTLPQNFNPPSNESTKDFPKWQISNPKTGIQNVKPIIPALLHFQKKDRPLHVFEELEFSDDEYISSHHSLFPSSIHPIDSSMVINMNTINVDSNINNSKNSDLHPQTAEIHAFPTSSGFDYPTFHAKASRRNSGILSEDKTDFFFKEMKRKNEFGIEAPSIQFSTENSTGSNEDDSSQPENNFMTGFNGYICEDEERKTQLYVSSVCTEPEGEDVSIKNDEKCDVSENYVFSEQSEESHYEVTEENLSIAKIENISDTGNMNTVDLVAPLSMRQMDEILLGTIIDKENTYLTATTDRKLVVGKQRRFSNMQIVVSLFVVGLIVCIFLLSKFLCKNGIADEDRPGFLTKKYSEDNISIHTNPLSQSNCQSCSTIGCATKTTLSIIATASVALVISLICLCSTTGYDDEPPSDRVSIVEGGRDESQADVSLEEVGIEPVVGSERRQAEIPTFDRPILKALVQSILKIPIRDMNQQQTRPTLYPEYKHAKLYFQKKKDNRWTKLYRYYLNWILLTTDDEEVQKFSKDNMVKGAFQRLMQNTTVEEYLSLVEDKKFDSTEKDDVAHCAAAFLIHVMELHAMDLGRWKAAITETKKQEQMLLETANEVGEALTVSPDEGTILSV